MGAPPAQDAPRPPAVSLPSQGPVWRLSARTDEAGVTRGATHTLSQGPSSAPEGRRVTPQAWAVTGPS